MHARIWIMNVSENDLAVLLRFKQASPSAEGSRAETPMRCNYPGYHRALNCARRNYGTQHTSWNICTYIQGVPEQSTKIVTNRWSGLIGTKSSLTIAVLRNSQLRL